MSWDVNADIDINLYEERILDIESSITKEMEDEANKYFDNPYTHSLKQKAIEEYPIALN